MSSPPNVRGVILLLLGEFHGKKDLSRSIQSSRDAALALFASRDARGVSRSQPRCSSCVLSVSLANFLISASEQFSSVIRRRAQEPSIQQNQRSIHPAGPGESSIRSIQSMLSVTSSRFQDVGVRLDVRCLLGGLLSALPATPSRADRFRDLLVVWRWCLAVWSSGRALPRRPLLWQTATPLNGSIHGPPRT